LEIIGKSCGNFREIIRAFSTLKQKTEVPIITTPLFFASDFSDGL